MPANSERGYLSDHLPDRPVAPLPEELDWGSIGPDILVELRKEKPSAIDPQPGATPLDGLRYWLPRLLGAVAGAALIGWLWWAMVEPGTAAEDSRVERVSTPAATAPASGANGEVATAAAVKSPMEPVAGGAATPIVETTGYSTVLSRTYPPASAPSNDDPKVGRSVLPGATNRASVAPDETTGPEGPASTVLELTQAVPTDKHHFRKREELQVAVLPTTPPPAVPYASAGFPNLVPSVVVANRTPPVLTTSRARWGATLSFGASRPANDIWSTHARGLIAGFGELFIRRQLGGARNSWSIGAGLNYTRADYRSEYNFRGLVPTFRPGTVDTIFRDIYTGDERIVTKDSVDVFVERRERQHLIVDRLGLPVVVGYALPVGRLRLQLGAGVSPTLLRTRGQLVPDRDSDPVRPYGEGGWLLAGRIEAALALPLGDRWQVRTDARLSKDFDPVGAVIYGGGLGVTYAW